AGGQGRNLDRSDCFFDWWRSHQAGTCGELQSPWRQFDWDHAFDQPAGAQAARLVAPASAAGDDDRLSPKSELSAVRGSVEGRRGGGACEDPAKFIPCGRTPMTRSTRRSKRLRNRELLRSLWPLPRSSTPAAPNSWRWPRAMQCRRCTTFANSLRPAAW